MNSDPEQPFSPPPSSAVPTVLIAVALGALAWVGYQALPGWFAETRRRAGRCRHRRRNGFGRPPTGFGGEAPIAAAVPPPPAKPAPVARPQPAWTRCEEGGRVSYSDAGCGGAAEKASSLTTEAALTTVPGGVVSPTTAILYRCKAYSGVVFWSTAHCNQKKALVDRMVEVPRGLSFKEKVAVAERAIPRQPRPAAAPRGASRPTVAAPRPTRTQRCELLKRSIEDIDARTRQPLTPSQQDFWREERKSPRCAVSVALLTPFEAGLPRHPPKFSAWR
ncbi:MAG: hypothetical protein R3E42_14590 [Burkholderiaceae bacterium]